VAARKNSTSGNETEESTPLNPQTQAIDDREKTVLSALSSEPSHIDTICASTGLPVQQVSATLMVLELKRLAVQQPGKFFIANFR
jgi:predicted Rossmann fold nucleotide-binding protein DprA/Smf involved in DNA uptake